MSVIEGLIRKEEDNTLSFGDYTLEQKSKVSGFEFQGDIYKVKTFKEITKLEKIVLTHDPTAFIIFTGARSVSGEGFKIYPIN